MLVIGIGFWGYQRTQSNQGYLQNGESIENWSYTGAYTGKGDLEGKANAEIQRLEGLLGKEDDDVTDYSLYVEIANQYNYLGNGELAYQNLTKAIAIDSKTTGLAWHNLATLFERLGAKDSARHAYSRAVEAQSQLIQYRTAYLEFLTENYKDETDAIESAFNDAKGVFGDNSNVLEIQARWQESVGKFQDAITTWNKVKELSPAAASIIDAEIARLQAQL